MSEQHPGREAIAHIGQVLEKRPDKDDHELTSATQCLAKFREELIAVQRSSGAIPKTEDRLSRLNAIISVVMAMHFPIGNPPWDEFENVQVWLRDLVEEIEA